MGATRRGEQVVCDAPKTALLTGIRAPDQPIGAGDAVSVPYEHMFAFSSNRPQLPASLAAKVGPVATASSRLLPVGAPWDRLLPEGALRRGTTVAVHAAPGSGGLTLALSLLGGASAAGYWCAVVGVDDPGVVAMVELGVDLRRVLFVPRPRGAWAESAADLFEGVDIAVLRTPSRAAHTAARRLSARTRDRATVLVVLSEPAAPWPLPVDLFIEVLEATWQAHSRLEGRSALIRVSGRGAARRASEHRVSLPDRTGHVLAS